jgi:hypothetical protein
MSKRTRGQGFARRPLDFYATPLPAVKPLIPYLRAEKIRTFAEPCVGEGDLAQHLEFSGLRCLYRGDLATGQDARLLTWNDCRGAQAIITNTPHTRALMHELIERFVGTGLPVWLLIDSDWMTNVHATPYLPRCSDIVVIGRVTWIEGTKKHSTDNFAWYRFHADHDGPTSIHNDRKRRTSAALELREGT